MSLPCPAGGCANAGHAVVKNIRAGSVITPGPLLLLLMRAILAPFPRPHAICRKVHENRRCLPVPAAGLLAEAFQGFPAVGVNELDDIFHDYSPIIRAKQILELSARNAVSKKSPAIFTSLYLSSYRVSKKGSENVPVLFTA